MRATGHAGLLAPIGEPVSEAGVGEGFAALGHEESEITAWRGVEDLLQLRQDWERQPLGLPVAAFELSERQFAIARVLPAESRHVRTALACEQQESKRQARLGADRMALLVLVNLFDRPGVIAVRVIALEIGHFARWIARRIGLAVRSFFAGCPLEYLAHCLEPVICSLRNGKLAVAQYFDRIGSHVREWHIAKKFRRAGGDRLVKGTLEATAQHALATIVEPEKVRALGKVFDAQPSPRTDRCRFAGAGLGQQLGAGFGLLIGSHERRRPWHPAKPHFGAVLCAEINSRVAVTVNVLNATRWQPAGHDARSYSEAFHSAQF